jgi:hypothetical protein
MFQACDHSSITKRDDEAIIVAKQGKIGHSLLELCLYVDIGAWSKELVQEEGLAES